MPFCTVSPLNVFIGRFWIKPSNPQPNPQQRACLGILNLLTKGILAYVFIVLGAIPLRIALTYHQAPQPQAILVLGGNSNRERFAAHWSSRHPNLPVWFSSGMAEEQAKHLFEQINGPVQQLHFDRQATDTITNFTSLVDEFQQQETRHLLLVTSDYHMMRSRAIASVVLGSRNIVVTAVSVPSSKPPETPIKAIRDSIRAVVWVLTGWSSDNFHALRSN